MPLAWYLALFVELYEKKNVDDSHEYKQNDKVVLLYFEPLHYFHNLVITGFVRDDCQADQKNQGSNAQSEYFAHNDALFLIHLLLYGKSHTAVNFVDPSHDQSQFKYHPALHQADTPFCNRLHSDEDIVPVLRPIKVIETGYDPERNRGDRHDVEEEQRQGSPSPLPDQYLPEIDQA